ncbi:MAG: DUF962 domain-containing protein [Pseudobdellovibrionaceae bacterium]
MSELAILLDTYGKSHQNRQNQVIHKICVPLIEWSLLGLLWSLPHPDFFGSLTWAHLLTAFSIGYYLRFKNWKVMVWSLLMLAPFWIWVSFRPSRLLEISAGVFALAWIGQFYGHILERKRPSFMQDLFFLLVGPLWVGETLLRRFHKSLL